MELKILKVSIPSRVLISSNVVIRGKHGDIGCGCQSLQGFSYLLTILLIPFLSALFWCQSLQGFSYLLTQIRKEINL